MALVTEGVSWILVKTLSSGASPADQEIIVAILGTEPMPPMPLYMLAGGGTACAIIAAAVSLGQRYPHSVWLRPFVSTGQLALTLYVAHVIVGMGTLEAMGRLENQTLPFVLLASTVFCTAGVVFSHLWRRRFHALLWAVWTGPGNFPLRHWGPIASSSSAVDATSRWI